MSAVSECASELAQAQAGGAVGVFRIAAVRDRAPEVGAA